MFDHQKLDVYRIAVEFATWAYRLARGIPKAERSMRDQWLRAAQSIPLNIAEDNGRRTSADRLKFFGIARGSALECAAILDLLVSFGLSDMEAVKPGVELLHREVSMLSKMVGVGKDRKSSP